jgi:hypothetical protein
MTTQQEFIDLVKNGAIKTQKHHGILASIIISQAILECCSGNGSIFKNSNNIFGVLANDWEKSNVYLAPNGYHYRKYDTVDRSLTEHGFYLAIDKNYKKIIGNKDYQSVSKILQESGYAGDTRDYAVRLNSIIKEYNLDQYDHLMFGVSYQGYVQKIGWQDKVEEHEVCGTEGKGLRLEGIRISLLNAPEGLEIKYRALVENVGWQNWVRNGELAGTTEQGLRMEAIQIMFGGKDADNYTVRYNTYIQNNGWMAYKVDGSISGTIDKDLRIEAIKIDVIEIENEDIKNHEEIEDEDI